MNSIIEVENVNFAYDRGIILKNISFEVTTGEFLAIAGPNGVGKTTLLNLLCGLLKPDIGQINIDSKNISSYCSKNLAKKVAVVRQEFVPVFDFTVNEIISMARTPYVGTLGFENKTDRKITAEALELTDTARFASRTLAQLSGGERQRVFIAKAIAQETPVLFLDEPTAYLDLKHQVDIYDLLKTTQLEKRKTVIAVTHDINLATQYCDRTLLLSANHTYSIGKTADVLSQQQIEKVFGIKTFVADIGSNKFFLPIGKFAKNSSLTETNPNNCKDDYPPEKFS